MPGRYLLACHLRNGILMTDIESNCIPQFQANKTCIVSVVQLLDNCPNTYEINWKLMIFFPVKKCSAFLLEFHVWIRKLLGVGLL